eukprot:s180_g21.t1
MQPGPGLSLGLIAPILWVPILAMAAPQPEPIDLTSPPPAEDGIEQTTPRLTNCTICLGSMSEDPGAEPIFTWPGCRHMLHLACTANLRAHNQNPSCPACRHPWNQNTDAHFHDLCATHGVLIPDPASRRHPTARNNGAPAPPPHVLPLCCNRLILADPAHAHEDQAWRELPERHTQWARHLQHTTGDCIPEWTCLRCNARGTQEWQTLVQPLRRVQPVPWQQLHQILFDLQDVQNGGRLTAAEANAPATLAQAARHLPPATQIHLPCAFDQVTDSSGYIPATVQEALLNTYLGDHHAGLLADQWRQPRPSHTLGATHAEQRPQSAEAAEPDFAAATGPERHPTPTAHHQAQPGGPNPPSSLNSRRARKGAARGPTGLTAETLGLVLDDEQTRHSFVAVAANEISRAISLGRIVALQKPNGGVRGIEVPQANRWQKAALQAVQQQLQPGETLFAFLDYVYTIMPPARVRPVYDLLAHHSNSTAAKPESGTRPASCPPTWADSVEAFGSATAACQQKSKASWSLGTPQYQHQHRLLLLFSASPRCNYQLRMLPPHDTQHFAAHHDAAVAACLTQLLDAAPLPAPALGTAHRPLHMGGLGLTSAVATATSAYWASWADVLPVLQAQAPQHAAAIHHMLTNPPEATPGIQTAIHSAEQLRQLGWEPPDWRQLLAREAVPDPSHDFAGPTLGGGWQHTAARACQRTHRHRHWTPEAKHCLNPKPGPMPVGPSPRFHTTPPPHTQHRCSEFFCSAACGFPYCRCRRALDFLGDHRAACPQSGILRSRGVPLEHESAAKREHASPPIPGWQISTCSTSPGKMTGA